MGGSQNTNICLKKGLKNPFFSLKKIIISIYINKKVEGEKNGKI